MAQSVFALAPIFLVILLGLALRRWDFPGEAFWPFAERLTYYVLFPALLVESLATADIGAFRAGPLALAIVSTILITTLVTMQLRRRLQIDGPAFTSIVQGAVRTNTYVGLALALALFGEAGLVVIALVIAMWVPTANLVSVTLLGRYAADRPVNILRVIGMVARNPLILACVAGIVLNLSGVGLPWVLEPIFELLGRGALPLGLLAVGAALDLHALGRQRRFIRLACVLKVIVMPALAYGACAVLGIEGLTRAVLVIQAALPSSPYSYVLARELGGDAALMSGIITMQTGLAFLSLPVVIAIVT